MELSFRPATQNDINPLAEWIFASASSRLNWVLNSKYVKKDGSNIAIRYVRRAFASPYGFYSYKNHMVVLSRRTPVATFAIYPYARLPWHAMLEAVKAARIVGPKSAVRAAVRRISFGISPFPELYKGIFFDNLYVSQYYRCRGVGQEIIDWISVRCLRSGSGSFGCDVEESNVPAIGLYMKSGGYIVRVVAPRSDLPIGATYQMLFDHK